MEESYLIKGIQDGDRKAFQILVETHLRMVVNTCLGIVHNKADAEDLAQDVFIETFRGAGNFKGDSKLSTWLYRIAINRSLNFIRDNKRKQFFESIDEAFNGERNRKYEISLNEADQPDKNITDMERSKILHLAIDHLPEKQRVAFMLNKYEELPYQQIAEIMKVSLSSVETLLHRAKKNLQMRLFNNYKKNSI
jgi:RNA polymerase sigma-70 factor (ECF subfamily)